VEDIVIHISSCESLETLKIDAEFSTQTFLKLSKLQNLRELLSFGSRVKDRAVECLRPMMRLEKLELCGGYLTNRFLEDLKDDFQSLTWLNLSMNSGLSDSGLSYLTQLKSLRYLNISGCSVTPSGVKILESES
jgi:hypothetical protein